LKPRGDLPPIAATLNKVLKRDMPGGFSSSGHSYFWYVHQHPARMISFYMPMRMSMAAASPSGETDGRRRMAA
jgi:hypothetical protein